MKVVAVFVVLLSLMEFPLKAESTPVDRDFLLDYSNKKIKEISSYSKHENTSFLTKHKYSMFLTFFGYYENMFRSVKQNKLDPSHGFTKTYRSLAHIAEVLTEHLMLTDILLENRDLTINFISFEKTDSPSEQEIRKKYYKSAVSENENILDKIYYNSMDKVRINIIPDGIFGSKKAWEKFKLKYFSRLSEQVFEEIFPWICLFDHLVEISEKEPVPKKTEVLSQDDFIHDLASAIHKELEPYDERRPTSDEVYTIVHKSIKKLKISRLCRCYTFIKTLL